MALVGMELEMLVSEPDTLITQPPQDNFAFYFLLFIYFFFIREVYAS